MHIWALPCNLNAIAWFVLILLVSLMIKLENIPTKSLHVSLLLCVYEKNLASEFNRFRLNSEHINEASEQTNKMGQSRGREEKNHSNTYFFVMEWWAFNEFISFFYGFDSILLFIFLIFFNWTVKVMFLFCMIGFFLLLFEFSVMILLVAFYFWAWVSVSARSFVRFKCCDFFSSVFSFSHFFALLIHILKVHTCYVGERR